MDDGGVVAFAQCDHPDLTRERADRCPWAVRAMGSGPVSVIRGRGRVASLYIEGLRRHVVG